jgi:hypothetical protein
VLDGALDPDLGIADTAARCGAIRSVAVTQLTTLLLVRYRFDLTIQRRRESSFSQLAEDVALIAFTGLPSDPEWLTEDQAEALLAAEPTGNIGPEQRVEFVQRVIAARAELAHHLDALAQDRAIILAEQHNRVRSETARSGRASVTAHLPVDVLGTYVLLPN